MERGIIVAGGGKRGLMFAHMLKSDLRRQVAAIAENNTAAHPAIRRRLDEWGMADTAVYGSLPQALGALPRSQADIVFIMTPDWTHLDVLRPAVSAGCHVFLEKPLATTSADVMEIVRLAHSTDKTVQVGFVLRYSPFARKVKAVVDSGALGKLVMIQMNERLELVHGAVFCRSWHRKVRYTGGFLNEKCSHDLDQICWLMEKQAAPKEVFSYGGRHFTPEKNTPQTCGRCRLRHCPWRDKNERCVFHSDGDIMDHQCANILFDDGAQAQFSLVAMSPAPGRDMRIFGTDGYLEGELEKGSLRLNRYWDPSGFQDVSVAASDGHGGGDTRIVAEFLDCVDRHEQPLSSVLDGARASLLAFAADESAQTHNAVPFAGIMRRLAAEGQRRARAKGRFETLAGRGFDSNLVIKGCRGPSGFNFTIVNPTDWPLEIVLRFSAGSAPELQDISRRDRLPIRKGRAVLTLRAHERKDLRLPGRNGKLAGVAASVISERADDMKRFVADKMTVYRRAQNLSDEDLKKILRFIQSDKTARELRQLAGRLAATAKKGDGLALANLTSGYAMAQLEKCLRLLPPDGEKQIPHPARLFVACGSESPFEDARGCLWQPPQPWIDGAMPWGYIGGARSNLPAVRIQGADNQRLYQNDWHLMSGFRFHVANGRYKVRLHFAETWFDRIGERLFDVRIQNQPALTALDVFKEAGGKHRALVKEFSASVKDGVLAVDFSPAQGAPMHAPMINGIEAIGRAQ